MPPTVLVIDDHAGYRASARALLEAEGFCVVGEVADGQQALDTVVGLHPDLVLLDILLPGMDGIDVAGRLARLEDPPDVVLISSHDAAAYGSRLSRAPVKGFLLKTDLSGEALRELLGE